MQRCPTHCQVQSVTISREPLKSLSASLWILSAALPRPSSLCAMGSWQEHHSGQILRWKVVLLKARELTQSPSVIPAGWVLSIYPADARKLSEHISTWDLTCASPSSLRLLGTFRFLVWGERRWLWFFPYHLYLSRRLLSPEDLGAPESAPFEHPFLWSCPWSGYLGRWCMKDAVHPQMTSLVKAHLTWLPGPESSGQESIDSQIDHE